MYVSQAKNTRNAHYGVSSSQETTEMVLSPHLSSIHFLCTVKISAAFQAHLNFIMGKQTYKQLSQIRSIAKPQQH